MIDWRNVDPQRFERAVQALLKSLYPELKSLDGAGGDGGRDALELSRRMARGCLR